MILVVSAVGVVPVLAHADSTAIAPVQKLTDGLVRVMKAGHETPFTQRFDMLAPVIDQTFDLTSILKASVGSAWDTFPPDQQSSLLKAFRRYTISSFINGFDQNNEHFVVDAQPRTDGDEQIVRVQVVLNGDDQYKLDHVMQRSPSGWRIVDILTDGAISRVAVQRSDFRQLIRQGGAAALAQSLETKSAALAN